MLIPLGDQLRFVQGLKDRLAADMREAGIHVGFGQPPVCVNCGEPWPCPTEREGQQ